MAFRTCTDGEDCSSGAEGGLVVCVGAGCLDDWATTSETRRPVTRTQHIAGVMQERLRWVNPPRLVDVARVSTTTERAERYFLAGVVHGDDGATLLAYHSQPILEHNAVLEVAFVQKAMRHFARMDPASGSVLQHTLLPRHDDENYAALGHGTETFVFTSYNVWNWDSGPGWDTHRCSSIAEVINATGTTVAVLQEVRRDRSKSMLDDLLGKLPQFGYWAWQPAMDFWDGGQEGVAVISQLPIVSTQYVYLQTIAGSSDANRRVCLNAQIVTPTNQTVNVYSAHWTYDDNHQVDNARDTLAFLTKTCKQGPLLLAGDFNCYIENATGTQYLSHTKIAACNHTGFLVDTGEKKRENTLTSWDPVKRADRIFTFGIDETSPPYLSGHSADRNSAPSDHLAVVLTVALPSPANSAQAAEAISSMRPNYERRYQFWSSLGLVVVLAAALLGFLGVLLSFSYFILY
eukprot:TRINITY_DN4955_c0_g1_i5.p1 TRINITY_DN4955_c0_g1~~TRINITY_DN4955_c0_g1_i5.p1  ORF type:complete len:461 (+),score=64.53 TRINITY_DN4955_c0_g1_i5:332-1714(+)